VSSHSSNIETLAIGDELLIGKISDTNSQFVATQLFSMGLRLSRETVVADDPAAITGAILESSKRAKVVIVFGGLGPTSDDKTAECVANILNCKVIEHPESKERLLAFLKKMGRQVSKVTLKQILYPASSEVITNSKGLAPGFFFKLQDCTFFFLPGVPMEMEAMVLATVLPAIQKQFQVAKLLSHTWRCLGIHESQLQEVMNPVEKNLTEGCYLGYRTSFPENHLTLYWNAAIDPTKFIATQISIRQILQPWAYTEGDRELEQVVVEELIKQKKTIALAESCTGGLALQRLTRVSGASEVVWGGFTSYQISAKEKMLGVRVSSNEEGVSQACSNSLASQLKKQTQVAITGAITGYMSATSGEKNPIGIVYLSVIENNLVEKKIVLPNTNRYRAQWGASSYLLQTLLQVLQGK